MSAMGIRLDKGRPHGHYWSPHHSSLSQLSPSRMPNLAGKDQALQVASPPVAIGGVGGSGTRLIARMLTSLGFDLGKDLNPANDNLAFTLLFKLKTLWPLEQNRQALRQSIGIFLDTMYYRRPLVPDDIRRVHELADTERLNAPTEWLQQRARTLLDTPTNGPAPERWGWKEPNTHIFLPALLECIPGTRYIHVVRHGLDMAFSVNQAQLRFWGQALTGEPMTEPTPQNSFNYWCAAHRRVLDIGDQMGPDFLLLNFDRFCCSPQEGLQQLSQFLQIDVDDDLREELLAMVRQPASTGRHLEREQLEVSPDDAQLLQRLGFGP